MLIDVVWNMYVESNMMLHAWTVAMRHFGLKNGTQITLIPNCPASHVGIGMGAHRFIFLWAATSFLASLTHVIWWCIRSRPQVEPSWWLCFIWPTDHCGTWQTFQMQNFKQSQRWVKLRQKLDWQGHMVMSWPLKDLFSSWLGQMMHHQSILWGSFQWLTTQLQFKRGRSSKGLLVVVIPPTDYQHWLRPARHSTLGALPAWSWGLRAHWQSIRQDCHQSQRQPHQLLPGKSRWTRFCRSSMNRKLR